MSKLLVLILVLRFCITPVIALELHPPELPEKASQLMPEETNDFSRGIDELLERAFWNVFPEVREAVAVCVRVIAVVLMMSVLQTFSGPVKSVSGLAGIVVLAVFLLQNTKAMIRLAAGTINDIVAYGKLLLPVMTSALAAQGKVTSSAALYAGSSFFMTVLSDIISELFLPVVYVLLSLATANSATEENMLRKISDIMKGILNWSLKTVLTVFTAYLSITGIVSGTTDLAALKATKLGLSTFVPVVGGILSDASEAVLVSAGLVTNAVGIYGLLAVGAIFLSPFLKIGVNYILLKLTALICGIFGSKQMTDYIADFTSVMGLLLGMLGATCLMQLISTVCFMRGVG